MAPDAPISGACESGATKPCGKCAGDRAEQVEDEVAEMAERILDIVAEHPQEQHVAAEMEDVGVQEGVGEVGRIVRHQRSVAGGRSAMS